MPGVDVSKQGVRELAANIHPRTNGLSAGGARQPVRWPARAQATPAKPTTKNASSAKGTAVTTECTTGTPEHPGSTVRDRQHDSAPADDAVDCPVEVPAPGIVPEGHDGTLGAKDTGTTIRGRLALGTHQRRDQQPPPRDGPRRRNLRLVPRSRRTRTRRPCTRRTSR